MSVVKLANVAVMTRSGIPRRSQRRRSAACFSRPAHTGHASYTGLKYSCRRLSITVPSKSFFSAAPQSASPEVVSARHLIVSGNASNSGRIAFANSAAFCFIRSKTASTASRPSVAEAGMETRNSACGSRALTRATSCSRVGVLIAWFLSKCGPVPATGPAPSGFPRPDLRVAFGWAKNCLRATNELLSASI